MTPTVAPDSASPPVPAANGPRAMVVLCLFCVFASALLLLATYFSAAPLAHAIGLGDQVDAVVVERSEHTATRDCDFVKYVVEWDDRRGSFTECDTAPLGRLRTGDVVRVDTAPWTSEVAVAGAGGLTWSVLMLLLGLGGTAQGVVSARRYHRLRRGVSGPVLAGRVTKVERTFVEIAPFETEPDRRRLKALPVKRDVPRVGDPVRLWPSRRSRVLGRPRGPWVLVTRGVPYAYTHAWRRRG